MDVEGDETLDIPCFLGKSFNIQDCAYIQFKNEEKIYSKKKSYIVKNALLILNVEGNPGNPDAVRL